MAKLTRGPGPGSLTPGPKFQIQDPVLDYARSSDCQTAKKKRFSRDVVALSIDAAPALRTVGIGQVDHWDEILHYDDDVLPEV